MLRTLAGPASHYRPSCWDHEGTVARGTAERVLYLPELTFFTLCCASYHRKAKREENERKRKWKEQDRP